MISAAKQTQAQTLFPNWRDQFLAMLPAIERHAAIAFRALPPETKEDAVQEAIANSFVAFSRLAERGKTDLAYPSVLARFAAAQCRSGRRVGSGQSTRDVHSVQAQINGSFSVRHLGSPLEQRAGWQEALADNTQSPVADQAAFRVDFAAWLARLSDRDRRIAEMLAMGERTTDVARELEISAGRVSQKRAELEKSWYRFHNESVAACSRTTWA